MPNLKWTYDSFSSYLRENGSEMLTSREDYDYQLNQGISRSKVKVDVKCNNCSDGVRYNVSVGKYINSKHQQCKACTSTKLSKQMSERNKQWWKDSEYRNKQVERARIQMTGSNNPNWRKDLSHHEREIQRNTPENHLLRKVVYERDNYTCQICLDNRGKNLVAHHLDGWNWAIDVRYDPSNVITLCEICHEGFHDLYGYGENTREQFNEYFYDYLDDLYKSVNKKQGNG